MPIYITDETADTSLNISHINKMAGQLLELCKLSDSELSILLVKDSRMAELNEAYRHKAKPTNVLSFPMSDEQSAEDGLLGDIVISVDTARREAQQNKITLHSRVTKLLIHGLVHCWAMTMNVLKKIIFSWKRKKKYYPINYSICKGEIP